MSREEVFDNINNEDFIIRVRPSADENGNWDGENRQIIFVTLYTSTY
jgi:hypothetical protein